MNKNLVIALLAIISVGSIGYIAYDKISNNDDNNGVKEEVDKKLKYTMEKTATIGIMKDNYQMILAADENGNIKLSYPVIDYNSEEITELNNLIKSKIDRNINDINSYNSIGDVPTCLKINIIESNKDVTFDHFVYYMYEIVETDNYLNIIEKEMGATTCASGFALINNVYVINKNTKRIINQDYLRDDINNDISLKLLDYIKTENDIEIYNNAVNLIGNKAYYVYYTENDNIIISFKSITGSYNLNYEYDGTNFKQILQ